MTIDGSDSLVLEEKKIRTRQLGNKPGTSWLSFRCSTNWATGEFMSSPSKPSHYPVTISVCVHHMPLQAGDFITFGRRVASVYKGSSRLFCYNIWRLSLNDNRWLWQSGAWREKIRTRQLGNKPGTSWLSFRCSTNWATGEFMSSPSKPSHYPVTISVCVHHMPLQAGDFITFGRRGYFCV